MNMFVSSAAIAAAPAAAMSAPVSAAAHGGPDPIFAAIEAHKTASADFETVLGEVVPGTLCPDPIKEELFGDREAEARRELATIVPTTMSGLLAMLTYIEDVSNGKYSLNGNPNNGFEEHLLNVVISAQDSIRAMAQKPVG